MCNYCHLSIDFEFDFLLFGMDLRIFAASLEFMIMGLSIEDVLDNNLELKKMFMNNIKSG